MRNNNKQGFTLIELLGIIVLIAIIGIIVFVTVEKVLKGGKETAYEKQIKMIELAAKNWASDYSEDLPERGKTTTVNFMVLKMYGYLDLNVSDPNTGLCFPNDAFVDIIHDGNTGKIIYSVNIDSINNGQASCDTYNDEMLEYPNVQIYGGVDTLGSGQQTTLTIAYNYANIDEDKIKFKENIISGSGTKTTFSITNRRYNSDKKLYEIDILITAGSSNSAEVWIEVEEGAITLEDGRYSYKTTSNKIKIDNLNTNIARTSTGVSCTGQACPVIMEQRLCIDGRGSKSTIATFGEFHTNISITDYPSVSSTYGTGYGPTYNGYQQIHLELIDQSNIYYYVYVELENKNGGTRKLYMEDSENWVERVAPNESNKFYNTPTLIPTYSELDNCGDQCYMHIIDISVLINGTYHVGICDTNGNCSEEQVYTMRYNDCQAPNLVSSSPSDSTKLIDLFTDVASTETNYNGIPVHNSSDIYIVGALFLPANTYDTDLIGMLRYKVRNGKYSLSFLNEDYENQLIIYEGDTIKDLTLSKFKTMVSADLPYCDNYIYIIASDYAGNIGIYSTYIAKGSGCSSTSDCDIACQLSNNNTLILNTACQYDPDCRSKVFYQSQFLCSVYGYECVKKDLGDANPADVFCVSGSEMWMEGCH